VDSRGCFLSFEEKSLYVTLLLIERLQPNKNTTSLFQLIIITPTQKEKLNLLLTVYEINDINVTPTDDKCTKNKCLDQAENGSSLSFTVLKCLELRKRYPGNKVRTL
jgi:hypothetical protein